jgi:translocation protein SEC63
MTSRKWRIQFQAPPQVNSYLFQLHVKSDSYYGTDLVEAVVLKVQDASELEEKMEMEGTPDESEEGVLYALVS